MTVYNLYVGQSMPITLAGNPTTGYGWTYDIRGDENAISVDGDYVPMNTGLVGSGGQYVYNVQAMAPGTATVLFFYERSWESVPVKMQYYTFIVKPLLKNASPVGGYRYY